MVHIFSPLVGRKQGTGRAAPGLILLAALSLGGCASVPPPDGAMNIAQGQLQAARDAQAADYAPVDLGFAQDKFQQAQAAMAQRKYADASLLAEEARADAELARAKARLAAARGQMQSKLEENNRLRVLDARTVDDATQNPAASSLPGALPAEQPQDMPAPPASMLSPAPGNDGFQTMPEQPLPRQGDQSDQPRPDGEQP